MLLFIYDYIRRRGKPLADPTKTSVSSNSVSVIIVYQSNPRGKPLADQTKTSVSFIIYLLSLMDCGVQKWRK